MQLRVEINTWFLLSASSTVEYQCLGGEEIAGASFFRINGRVCTTDNDGFIPTLLSAEITAKSGRDPEVIYKDLTREYGKPI